jgi:NADPH:quinone reductase-like Zn-dependent oxidoreductase
MSFGGPEALGVHEVPTPEPDVGEVRIRVRAAAVSPTDTHVRVGTYGPVGEAPPYVPGMDAAGVVDAVGSSASSARDGELPWQVGDRVMAFALPHGPHGGAYAEYLVGPWQSMARIPMNADLVSASTLPMNGLTAYQALEKLALDPGQVLAITGAAGTLGSYTLALAKWAGLTVVADAAEADRPWLEESGADHVVPRGAGFVDAVRDLYPNGVDAVMDGAVLDATVVPAIRKGGKLATVRFWEGPEARGIETHVIRVRDEYRSHHKLDFLRARVEDGTLKLRVAGTLPAERASEAHRRLEAGGVRGRIVLAFDGV